MEDFVNIKSHLWTYSDAYSKEETVEAKGAWFKDDSGKSFLNLNDISCVLGYGHNSFNKRLAENVYSKTLGHFGILSKEKEQMIAHFMEVTDGAFDKVFIAGSGGEVVDWSLKVARRFTGRDGIVSFDRSLHGRSFAGAYISGLPMRKEGFGTGLNNVYFWDSPGDGRSFEPGAEKFKDVAAVIIEPYQAANGLNSASLEYWKWLRDFTKENGIVLIFDEIQTGFGKTGTFFAYEKFGIVPDILLLGKGMSNGFGLGAMLASEEIGESVKPMELSGGSADNDFMCSVVNSVFEIYEEEKIIDNVKAMGELLRNRMSESLLKHNIEPRFHGDGLFMGVELPEGISSKVVSFMKEEGVIAGRSNDRLVVRAPLILKEEEIELAACAFEKALNSVID